jgi:glycerate 2-kinase
VLDEGINAILSLCRGPMTLDEAVAKAPALLTSAATQAVRCYLAGRHHARESRQP